MAKNEIIRLSREYGDERRDEINSVVSRYVSAITEGKYDLAEVDETGKLRVQTEGREVLPEALSRGTLEQFYFAFRMAVGSIVTQEEPLPLLLDETFAMYDDDRLRQTLLASGGKRIADDPVYLPETGTEAVRGTGNRIPYDKSHSTVCVMCKVGQDGTARHVRKGQGGIRWLQRKRRKNIGDSGYLSKYSLFFPCCARRAGLLCPWRICLRGEQHPQGSGQSGTEFHGGDVPEIPHKRCVCGGRQCDIQAQ